MGSIVRKIVLVILIAISWFVIIDVNQKGGYKDSKTQIFLRDSGVESAFYKFRSQCQQFYRWSKVNVPIYLTKCRENLLPVMLKIWDFVVSFSIQMWTNLKLICQYIIEQKPKATKWIETQFPGLLDNLSLWFEQAWSMIKNFTYQAGALILEYNLLLVKWLHENVFIGKMSPENLQKYSLNILNTTQTIAAQTISWISSKVVTITSSA